MNIRSKLAILLSLLVLLNCLSLSASALGAAPSQAGKKVLSGGQRDFAFPVPGHSMLSSCFYDNRNHCALDFPAPKGTPVVASYAGTVIATYNGCSHNYGKRSNCCDSGFGNYVVLKHDYVLMGGEHITLYSSYNHLTKATVSVGQTVSRGQQVGTIGSTGYSTGHHLDYQILLGGWTPFRSYSIDPYINELLELPENLHSMNSGGCCSQYVAYVKEYYPRCLHESFNAAGSCTGCGYTFDFASTRSTAAMGIYTAAADTAPANKPYAAALGSAGYPVKAGTEVSVSASVTNGAGESWYQLANGGYVPKSALRFVRYLDSKIDGAITAPAECQTLKKESYTLSGTVNSLYPLKKVSGYIDGTYYGSWTGSTTSLSLTGTDINNKLFFATLSPGKHTLTVTATDTTGRGESTVIQRVFYIEQSPVYHTVTLSLDGGSCETESLSILQGSAVGQLPTPVKEGQNFAGWYLESGEAATAGTVITAPITLLARWEASSCTVTLGDTQLTAAYGQPVQLPQPQQEGIRFLGWFTEENGGSEFSAGTPVTGDLVLYPHWEVIQCNVTLDPGEGVVAWRSKTVTYGETYGAFPTPYLEGYRFVGWGMGSNIITDTSTMTTDTNHTLTAVWEPLAAPSAQADSAVTQFPIWTIPVGLAGLLAAAAVFCWHRQQEDTPAAAVTEENAAVQDVPEETEVTSEGSPAEEEPVTQ